jgi:hypothetical protein
VVWTVILQRQIERTRRELRRSNERSAPAQEIAASWPQLSPPHHAQSTRQGPFRPTTSQSRSWSCAAASFYSALPSSRRSRTGRCVHVMRGLFAPDGRACAGHHRQSPTLIYQLPVTALSLRDFQTHRRCVPPAQELVELTVSSAFSFTVNSSVQSLSKGRSMLQRLVCPCSAHAGVVRDACCFRSR